MKKILVVEDDTLVRNLLCTMLEKEGYEMVAACNGKEGVEIFLRHQPDLVITDLIMPEQDGIETIIELRKIMPDLKIIAISGGGQIGPGRVDALDYLSVAKTFGADKILSKPIERADLIKTVRDILEQSPAL
jgi:CheY-like chemotaxis protein